MKKIKVANRAELDLVEIGDFIAKDSLLNANRFVQKLRKNFITLKRQPHIGRSREDLSPGLRSIYFGRYVIFYRISENYIEIARVIHSARDIKRLFQR